MRVHQQYLRASLLLIALTQSLAASTIPEPPAHSALSQRAPPQNPEIPLDQSRRSSSPREGAPIHGPDGKPQVGPFVASSGDDTFIDEDVLSRAKAKLGTLPVAEDGVMNDPSRRPPKKGTTGIEGGVTEKDHARAEKETNSGVRVAMKPSAPKEAPSEKLSGALDSAPPHVKDNTVLSKAETLKDIAGLEKPAHLADRPHDLPYPDPPAHDSATAKKSSAKYNKPVSGFVDDTDNDSDDFHDLIRWDSLFGSFSSIAATEIGDKTFIVAALMAMRHPRLQVFSAAFSALFVMTILSGFAGHAIGAIISKRWSAVLAAGLFLVFGAKSLKEGMEMDANAGTGDEMREVQAELEEKEADIARQEDGRHRRTSSISPYALESGRMDGRSRKRSPSNSPSGSPHRKSFSPTLSGIKNLLGLVLSPAWVETFSMTFVGELGDRSQIATVAMAAGQEYIWIIVGATIGHFVCTAIAVLGGSVLAGRVSMRKVTLAGGAIFVLFGLFTLYEAIEFWRNPS